jgi:hypothetical protein
MILLYTKNHKSKHGAQIVDHQIVKRKKEYFDRIFIPQSRELEVRIALRRPANQFRLNSDYAQTPLNPGILRLGCQAR